MMRAVAVALVCDNHVGLEHRVALFAARERRAFLEPASGGGLSPQRLPARIAQRPADRFVVVIHGLVVARVDLDAVPIGIADVEEEGVGDAVPAGPALQARKKAGGRHHVAQVDDVERGRRPVGEVVQARTGAVGEGEIVHVALAMHPAGWDRGCRGKRRWRCRAGQARAPGSEESRRSPSRRTGG